MAPNRCETLTMSTNAQPTSDVATLEEMPFKLGKRSLYARCSSVSVSAEEESVHLQDIGKDYYRSIASWNLKTTSSLTILGSFSDLEALDLENLPGVCSGLDDDPRRRTVKQRAAIEPENKNSKEAVENDDNSHSFSFWWQQKEEITVFPLDTENRCEKKTTKEPDLKEFMEEDEIKDFKFDLLTIPYPTQESSCCPEGLPSLEPPSASSEDLEVQDDISMKEETTNDETAQVKIEEAWQPVKTESKHKIVLRRQAGKRLKRNIWSITVPDPPAVQHKQVKKTRKTVHERKPKNIRKRTSKQPCVSHEVIIESVNHIKPAPPKKKKPNSNLSEPRDSGVQSEGSSSGGSDDGCSSSSGSGGGGFSGGNSSGGGCGGKGSADGDGGDKKKYPQWYFPGKQQTDIPVRNKKKRSVEKDDRRVEKMEVDFSSTNQSGLQMFLPSKVDNPEQCHSPGEEGTHISTTRTGKSDFVFLPQDVQHASYCSNANCLNHKCKNVKLELEHMQVHKEWQHCGRCVSTRNIVKQHAGVCRRPGCRVPDCEILRNSCKSNGEPVPVRQRKVSQPGPVPLLAWTPFAAPVSVPVTPTHIDGRVIFRNSTDLPQNFCTEHTDYLKMTKEKLGNGSNGDIFTIYLQSDRSKKMALKETRYPIGKEEVEVYKLLGDHPHIVTHYAGTLRGHKGHANIFMEKCEQSLYDYMESMSEGRLDVEKAMFYWLQMLTAVDYLHNLKIPVIHKDIKAKNVLLTAEGSRAKLADFDSARRLHHELTEAGLKPLGTKGFASPEVLEQKPHGRPADIYNLGCFLIELIVGVPSKDSLQEQIEELGNSNHELGQLVFDCTKENPQDRPTARSLLQRPVVQAFMTGVPMEH